MEEKINKAIERYESLVQKKLSEEEKRIFRIAYELGSSSRFTIIEKPGPGQERR
jgi:hypothetical protein